MGLKQIYNFIARLNKRDNPYTIVDEQVILTEGKWEGFLAHDQVIEKTIEIYTLPNKEGERVLAYTLDKKEEVWKTYLKVFSQSEVLYITYETYGDTVEAEDINQLQGAAYYLENFIENVKNKLHSHDEDKVRHITGKERESWNSRAFQKDLEVTNQNLQMTNENLEATNQNLGLTQQELLSHKNAKDNPHAVTKHQVGLGNVEDIQQASKAEFILHKEDLSNPHQVTKVQVGLGNLDNIQQASKVEFNTHTTDNIKHITSSERNNWNDKYTKAEVDNKLASLETKIDWKESVATFEDIASTYPNPVDGWTVNVKDTDYTYRYNGTEWVVISANAIPKATSQVDGLMAKEDKTNLDDMNSKKHTHSNKSLIDTLTQVLINNWNSAFTHISDAIKHITATERTLWNTVSNKVDKVSGKGLSTEDYTTVEKSKLSGIEANANRYVHPNDANTRHVTDAEKTTWNGKANASHGNHVPATQSANNKKFLRCDNTWQDVTPGNIGAAALEHDHDSRYYTESEANAKFVSKEDLGAAGYGDMTKAVYDKNGNGAVDKAESVPWTGVTGKPSTFPPSSHNHDGSYATKNLRASHYTRFTVGGEANKYYPVIINDGSPSFGACHLSISRGYNWTAPDSWNTATHRGGLTLGILWNGDNYWGGNSGSSYVVTMFDESYTTMVGGLSYCTSGLVVWLRGGGAQYQIESDYGIATTVEVKLTDFTDSANRVFPVRSNTNSVEVEVRAKFTNRSGALYDQGARVYSPKNKPTAADVGALPKKGLTWNDLKGV
ncbi:MAG: hypothetical protein E6370_17275 [Clostridiales bacterium]|nr:hypothetical protein [Clostridiales bacterium]MDU6976020.1 hypothetical protein [Clostridiales bacterium]